MSLQGPKRSITPPLAQPSVQCTLIIFAMAITVAMVVAAAWRSPSRSRTGLADEPSSTGNQTSRLLIDINTAAARELAVLPGIGPVLAKRIVDDRNHRGEFVSVQDMQRVFGVGPKIIQQIGCYCTTGISRQNSKMAVATRPTTRTPDDQSLFLPSPHGELEGP